MVKKIKKKINVCYVYSNILFWLKSSYFFNYCFWWLLFFVGFEWYLNEIFNNKIFKECYVIGERILKIF